MDNEYVAPLPPGSSSLPRLRRLAVANVGRKHFLFEKEAKNSCSSAHAAHHGIGRVLATEGFVTVCSLVSGIR
jgi:hypothetical protein